MTLFKKRKNPYVNDIAPWGTFPSESKFMIGDFSRMKFDFP